MRRRFHGNIFRLQPAETDGLQAPDLLLQLSSYLSADFLCIPGKQVPIGHDLGVCGNFLRNTAGAAYFFQHWVFTAGRSVERRFDDQAFDSGMLIKGTAGHQHDKYDDNHDWEYEYCFYNQDGAVFAAFFFLSHCLLLNRKHF